MSENFRERSNSLIMMDVIKKPEITKIKNKKLRETMQQFRFTDILQMQYVELQPNSVIPLHFQKNLYIQLIK